MKRLFKRSLALLLALTMVLGNTLSMTSAAPVSVSGGVTPRIVTRAEAEEEKDTGTQGEETPETPIEDEEETPETPESNQEEEPEQDPEQNDPESEENGEPTDPEDVETDKEQEPEKTDDPETEKPEQEPEEDQKPEEPEQENPEEEDSEIKDPEEQDPETETPDEEVQDPDAQNPTEDEPEQEEDPKADTTEEEENDDEAADDEDELPDNDVITETAEFYQEIEVNGVVFVVTADEGVLPEGTYAEVELVEDEAVNETLLEKAGLKDEEAPVFGAYRITLVNDEYEITESAARKVKVAIYGVEMLSENSELFEVGEENHIPTDVYKIEEPAAAPQNGIARSRMLMSETASYKVRNASESPVTKADKEAGIDGEFMLGGTSGLYGVVMSGMPDAVNFYGLDLYADYKVTVDIEGVSGHNTDEISVGDISADTVPEYPNYTFVNATYDNVEVIGIGVYEYGNTRYVYYTTDGTNALLISNGKKVVLHYKAADLKIEYAASEGGSVIGPEYANAGQKVTVTAEPELGYETVDVIVTSGAGDVKVTDNGDGTFTFTMPAGSAEISGTFKKADGYTVTLVPLGNSADYDFHSYIGGKDCQTIRNYTVNNGDTLKAIINVDDDSSNGITKPLNYITINGERIDLNRGECSNVHVGEMVINSSISKHSGSLFEEPKHVISKLLYTIEITNIQQDIELGYFIKDEGVIDDRTITVDQLSNGIDLYVKEEGKPLRKISLNEVITLEYLRQQVYFYVKVNPGYTDLDISGTGVNRWDSIEASVRRGDPASEEAQALGCQWELHFTRSSGDETDRTIQFTADPIYYKVNYNSNGGTDVNDNNVYTVEAGNNTITVAGAPEKSGYVFEGWKLRDTVYQPSDTVEVNADLIKLAAGNTFTFEAQWVDAAQVGNYKVEYYKETEPGTGTYNNNPDYVLNLSGTVNEEVVANNAPTGADSYRKPFDFTGLTLDSSADGFKPVDTIKQDGSLVLKLYYASDSNNNDEPDYSEEKYSIIYSAGTFNDQPIEGVTGLPNPIDVLAGTSQTVASAPTAPGYDFTGWSVNVAGVSENPGDQFTMPESNVTFTARWERNEDAWTTVTFAAGEGGNLQVGNVTEKSFTYEAVICQTLEEADITIPSAVADKYYVFDGWETEAPEASDKVTKDLIYTAVFAEDKNGDQTADKDQIQIVFDLDLANHPAAEFEQTAILDVAYVDEAAGTATYYYDVIDIDDGMSEEELIEAGEKQFNFEAPSVSISDETFVGWIGSQGDTNGHNYIDYAKSTYIISISEPTTLYFKASYGDDENHDGYPDSDQILIKFDLNNAGAGFADTTNLGKGDYYDEVNKVMIIDVTYDQNFPAAPKVNVNEPDKCFDEWNDSSDGSGAAYTEGTAMTLQKGNQETYYLQLADDLNGDDKPDEDQKLIVTFVAGEHGKFNDLAPVYELLHEEEYPAAPTADDITITTEGYVLTGWKTAAGEDYPASDTVVEIPKNADAQTVVYIAQYMLDKNGDGIDDNEEIQVALRPYATTIYTGGQSNYTEDKNAGFPELELELKYGTDFAEGEEGTTRVVDNSLVTRVNINGKWLESSDGEGINKYLEAIYVYPDPSIDGGYRRITKDNQYRADGYIAVIAVKDTALEAFPGIWENEDQYESENGFIRNNKTGRFVTISESSAEGISSIGVEAHEGTTSGQLLNYFVNIETSELFIREVNNETDTIREMVNVGNEAAAVAHNANDRAAAMPGEPEANETVAFYTNGDRSRAEATAAHVKLLVDDVKDEDNRRELIEARALEDAYKMSYQDAKAEGYDSQLKFLDLVDTQNGNAWVESATGTYVYWPYPDGTDENTEFTIRHFEGLDRETNYDGASAVATAIEQANLEDEDQLLMTKTSEGIRFFTDGKLAFSPFILMWKTDDTPGGGDHGGSTGPTPVSITNSGNPEDNYYTVGVNGQWVHMDNVDMNTPLDEAVPSDATAIGAPEWHRWRFYLANGTMLYNQWGHIENPYAVDGQPRSGWFYFDENGLMRYGWYLDARSGDWYYMHSESDGMLGTMITGWHYDTNDGKWYYLDPATGAMKTGWQQIDGKWYYFNPTPVGETWTQDQSTSVWRFNGNTVRPYGSMYQNETTPDGYYVDANGVRQ